MSRKHLSLIEVTSLGVGTMIGAGIFALFGQISTLAGGYAWLAFLVSAVISALAGYSYSVISELAQTNGGIAEYLTIGWRSGLIGRTIALCYYFSVAITLGMVAETFGHYAVKLFSLGSGWLSWLGIAVMLVFLIVNAIGVKFVGVSEKILVGIKLVVLIGFTAIAFTIFDPGTYAGNNSSVPFEIGKFVNAVALANLSFAGFAVIANAGGSVVKGRQTIGWAIYIAVAIVALIYIALDIAVFGSIDLQKIESAKNYALAEAARPVLGSIGFIALGATALLSTMTNINANIFSGTNTIAYMSRKRQVSPILSRHIFLEQGNLAMLFTVAIVIVLLLTLKLSQIGDVASLAFLLVHTFMPLGVVLNVRERVNAWASLLWLAVITNGALMLFFIYHLAGKHNLELYVFAGVVIFAIVFCAASARLVSQD